ncbi:MAG: hypothetical protein A2X13_01470 [Bacteroidetes bacterium GWC2_33_15]|nr:MAG: hypothetical protein A2X10_08155 [Bacteroidetes bacterium GWA2_33_15]OFX52151.1 MAG: hypothetical protein A2X13_01470 [Bacteroidetes bacterium GWC2_33_15]OFX64305.1 MAG: hypothetical protein A2X15_12290 [Bacteroidetes bacterium GWB2_32_14]OFX67710.1 MAG: hypothetical protein A2X14_06115 [Bacteroidetes bacterium GWD2_33_33]HAN19320.1 helicase SNF2 [Bacteroidales bacterium]
MTSKKELVVVITDHPILGLLLVPYIIVKKPNHGYYQIEVRISQFNSDVYLSGFSENEKKLVKLADEYSEQNLYKLFSKNKSLTTVNFMNSLTRSFADEHIRPYIEKRLVKIINLLQAMDIEVYFKGKASYINRDDLVTVTTDKAQAIFNISKLTDESQYYLTIKQNNKEISLLNKSGFTLVNDPCRIIINNSLYCFEDINAKKLTPFFNKECIHIPKASEKKWFETFALDSIRQYNVKAYGFTVNQQYLAKEATLSYEINLKEEPCLVLSFIYNDNIKFSASEKVNSSVKFEIVNGEYVFNKIERDFDWEKTIIQSIESIGLRNIQDLYFIPEQIENSAFEEKHYELVYWLSKNIDKLESFHIKFLQRLKEKQYLLKEPDIQSIVNEENDWFDIQIEVQIGEYRIPFTRLRKNILNGIREYKLPGGEIVVLPKEWFEKYKELFQFGTDTEKSIQLQKHHFGVIETSVPERGKSILERYKSIIENYNKQQFEIPKGLNATLRPYQTEGFSWMYMLQQNNFGGCLADDMGLGKTIQTLTLLLHSKGKNTGVFYQPEKLPALKQLNIFDTLNKPLDKQSPATSIIVMPTSLIHNWEKEIKKFTPEISIYKFIGTNRTKDLAEFSNFDIILTTYGVVRNDIELLRNYMFFYIILDESQYIKNPDSKIYKSVIQLKSQHKLVLTGTPIENSLTDLWAQINFLNKGLLGNLRFFKQEFVQGIEKNGNSSKKERLQQFIQPFVLRRTKDQVAKDLPDKSELVIYCDMTDEQKSYYETEKSKIRNSILETIEKTKEKPTILAIEGLSKLRQIANHPVLIDETYTSESGKFEEITRNIENLIAEKHKVLVFSAYVKHLNLVSKYLSEMGSKFSILTGSTTNRQQVIDDFQNSDDNHVFLIQIKAGGVGLNLTSADYVFIIDPWWNPAVEEQAINRTHRIGQDKKVIVYRFISTDTVEEKIQRLKSKKTELAESFINTNQSIQKMNIENILELLK